MVMSTGDGGDAAIEEPQQPMVAVGITPPMPGVARMILWEEVRLPGVGVYVHAGDNIRCQFEGY